MRSDEDRLEQVGEAIRVNPRTERGQEVLVAYIHLGSCLEYGVDPIPERP